MKVAKYLFGQFVEWLVIIVIVESAVNWAFSDPVVVSKIVTKGVIMGAAVTLGRWFVWGRPEQ